MFTNFIKMAWRNIKHYKMFFLNNITGLAIGIACSIVIMLWVRHELSYNRFHSNIDRLYRVCFYTDTNNRENKVYYNTFMPGGLTDVIRADYPEITHASLFGFGYGKLANNELEQFGRGAVVHPDFLEMFSFTLNAGDKATALNTPMGLVITQKTATRLFPGEPALGKMITMNDQLQCSVSGVVDTPPVNSDIQFDFLMPYEMAYPVYKSTNVKTGEMYVMLDEKCDWQEVNGKINAAYNNLNPNEYPNYLFLQPLNQIHLHQVDGKGGRITYIFIFSVMALFILFMACINFINLSTARASIRAREIAIKKVIGAERMQLIVQFIGESMIFSLAALFIAVILVKLTLPMINAYLGESLPFRLADDWFILLLIAIVTGLAAGSYPAFLMSGFKPIGLIKGEGTGSIYGRSSMFRKVLVTAQFTLSIFFVVCITIVYSQLHYFQTKSLGYDKDNIIIAPVQQAAMEKSDVIRNQLAKSPNILNVSLSQFDMTQWNASAGLTWPGKDPNNVFDVGMNRVDANYLNTLGMEMAAGRFFSPEYPSDLTNSCVVNEEAVKAMKLSDPVGTRITWAENSSFAMTATIIGVVKNYHTESLHKPIGPFILFNGEQGGQIYVRYAPGKAKEALRDMEAVFKQVVPDYKFSYSFLDDDLFRFYKVEVFTKSIVLYITIIAIIITVLGLLGLTTFNARRRTKEIGIRKILGASANHIIAVLVREYVVLIAIAILLSWPTAFLVMHKWLQNFAYRVTIEWWMFALAGVIVMFIAQPTIAMQIISAARSNPVEALRYE